MQSNLPFVDDRYDSFIDCWILWKNWYQNLVVLILLEQSILLDDSKSYISSRSKESTTELIFGTYINI